MTTKLSTLIRNLRIGERLSFDNGRIVLGLDGNSPKTARLRLTLHADVVVDKPTEAANEARGGGREDRPCLWP